MSDDPQDKDQDLASEENNDSIRRFLGDYEAKKDEKDEAKDEEKNEKSLSEDEAGDKETSKETAETFTKEEVDKTISEAKKEVLDKIKSSFGLTDEEQKDLEDKGLTPPWEQEKRTPKTYREIAEFSAELAEYRRKKAEAVEKKQRDEADKVRQESEKQLNAVWDSQLDELREAGKLPKIAPEVVAKIKSGNPLTETEAKDEGLVAQRELFTKMYEVAEARKRAGKPVSTNLKEIYYEHYQTPSKKQVPGADAPVSGGSAKLQEDDEKFSYKDIHGQSYYDIINS